MNPHNLQGVLDGEACQKVRAVHWIVDRDGFHVRRKDSGPAASEAVGQRSERADGQGELAVVRHLGAVALPDTAHARHVDSQNVPGENVFPLGFFLAVILTDFCCSVRRVQVSGRDVASEPDFVQLEKGLW